MAGDQSVRHHKRFRVSDGSEKVSRSSDQPAKRRRTSEGNDTPTAAPVNSSSISLKPSNGDVSSQDVGMRQDLTTWSFSRPVGGRYSNEDPIMTADEAYLFVGLDMAVQVFATSTSRLLRTLQMENGEKVIGFRISPTDQDILYVFTSSSVTRWHWNSGEQLARLGTNRPTISIDLPLVQPEGDFSLYVSIVIQKDGKRGISINKLGEQSLLENIVLATSAHVNFIKVAYGGRVLVASDDSHVFLGTTTKINTENLESTHFTWRDATLPVTATSLDVRESFPAKGPGAIDLVVGETGGSILIYNDIVNTLLGYNVDKKPSPRRLHWHRGAVSTLRWSHDGNYIVSGGQESVLVLWQLDTGRKQFLPHLSSPICNVVVSPNGNSYVIKLADNTVTVLSTRELQPSASLTGLQLCTDGANSKTFVSRNPNGAVAALHPQRPERLLIAVPASHHIGQQGLQTPNAAMLQTFDIRSNTHISRQALARTNTTTLTNSPEGLPIVAPDVRQMDLAHDGKWLATIDSWTPHPQDVEAVGCNGLKGESPPLRSEVHLKFWKWTASSDMWELVTRIDAPHCTGNQLSTILGLVAHPHSYEFATLGADAVVRFWCPTTRHRSGLKTDLSEPHLDTWKCRGLVDFSGYHEVPTASLKSACTSFSEDGSVLAVCLPPVSGASGGHVLLINARNCTVHYQRTDVFSGNPCSVKFLGRYTIVASTGSIAVWDTVDDVVKAIRVTDSSALANAGGPILLAANPRTQTFAIASRNVEGGMRNSHKRRRRARFQVQIYDIPSFDMVFQENIGSCPLALLSDVYSGDYVLVDATASVQRLGCLDKPQGSSQPYDITSQLNTGLASIFSRNRELNSAQAIEGERPAIQNKGLARVFGDAPSFSLPSIGVLFRNVVETLGSS